MDFIFIYSMYAPLWFVLRNKWDVVAHYFIILALSNGTFHAIINAYGQKAFCQVLVKPCMLVNTRAKSQLPWGSKSMCGVLEIILNNICELTKQHKVFSVQ